MKRIIRLLLVAFVLTLTFLPVFTKVKAEHPERVIDEMGLLTEEERQELEDLCDEVSERQQVDVVIV
ncbi:MAG TPA: TPM domain-containing protein, partial [Erysipelotrichaceae bacterium]|nr:TPM domain-containing protein [Erysipelotrichaceae bacterium]